MDHKRICLNAINTIQSVCETSTVNVEDAIINNNIHDVIYESHCSQFDISDDFNNYMNHYNSFTYDYVQEGAIDKVKNFFKKALEMIKRFFSFIGRMITKLFDILFKRKPKKTVDQIAGDIITETPTKSTQEVSWEDFNKEKDNTIIHFPSSENSAIKECDITLMTKQLSIALENGEYVVGPVEGFKGDPENDSSTQERWMNIRKTRNGNFQLNCFLSFVDNWNDYRTNLVKIIDLLTTNSNDTPKGDDKDELAWCIKWKNYLHNATNQEGNSGRQFRFSSKLLLDCQKIVNQTMKKLMVIDTIAQNEQPEYQKLVKQVVDDMTCISIGCNQFSLNVKGMYMIDKKYLHTINDVKTLSKFVSSMIQSGIPSAQVAYNTWCVMSEDFDDRRFFLYEKDGTFKAPRWGQTRVVFFPANKPKEVLKIALNSGGLIANKRENQIYEQYKKCGKQDILAKPLNAYENYTIITMEKLSTLNGSSSVASDIKNKLDAIANKQNVHRIGDINDTNIGRREDGSYAVIDYAG